MPETSQAFSTFEEKWLAAYPENALVSIFLPRELRQRASAFGCLVYELTDSAFQVVEVQVAAAKLSWWTDELTQAASGNARHPITRTLFADHAARASERVLWPAMAQAALGLLDQPGVSTLAESFEQLEPFYGAVARSEAALFWDVEVNIEANAALWTISHLLRELANLPLGGERPLLPQGLLARHGLTRAGLDQPSKERSSLVNDYLDELATEAKGALGIASMRTLSQRVRVRLDVKLMQAARPSADPLQYLQAHARASRWQSLWVTWREARAMYRGR